MEARKSIVLFSNECPKCKVLKKKLQMCEIHYSENKDYNRMKELGFTSVPMLQVNEKMLNFCEAVQWINSMGAH